MQPCGYSVPSAYLRRQGRCQLPHDVTLLTVRAVGKAIGRSRMMFAQPGSSKPTCPGRWAVDCLKSSRRIRIHDSAKQEKCITFFPNPCFFQTFGKNVGSRSGPAFRRVCLEYIHKYEKHLEYPASIRKSMPGDVHLTPILPDR